jgi:hypothetical protein
MLATAQAQFPGYRVNLISGIDAHNGFARFSYAAGGTAEAPLYISGTDFVTLSPDGRLRTVIGFVGAAPAPVKQTRNGENAEPRRLRGTASRARCPPPHPALSAPNGGEGWGRGGGMRSNSAGGFKTPLDLRLLPGRRSSLAWPHSP